MANSHRGEVDLRIGGKNYAVALNLDAIGRMAEAIKVESIGELEARVVGLKIADAQPLMVALCAANGITVAEADLKRLHFRHYINTLMALWNAKPDAEAGEVEDDADPQKRAA